MITRSGQLLAASAKAINEQISLAHHSIDLVQERQIRFGLPPIIGKLLVAKIAKKVPGSIMRRVRICEAGSQELLSKLLKGEIDVAMLGSVAPLDEEKVAPNQTSIQYYGQCQKSLGTAKKDQF
jgi:DNA-binding transcriptional LysR family regulator